MGIDALLENQHGQWPKFRSWTYTIFLSQGVEIELMLYGQWSPRYRQLFKIAIFGHETWPLAKVPEVARILSFYPRGSKWSLFSLYGHLFFRDTGWISKFPYLGMKLAIGQSARSSTCIPSLPHWVEIEYIFALWAAISELRADFQNCYIWAWNLAFGQSSRSCTYTVPLSQGAKLSLFSHYG